MSVNRITCHVVQCDRCGEKLEWEDITMHYNSEIQAQEAATEADWKVDGSQITCLNCLEERNEP